MSSGAFFDEVAHGYDRAFRQFMHDLDGFYGAVVKGLPFGRDEGLRVLDLGAGTGLLSAVVAERFPAARVTLVDVSEEMLRVARRRFAGQPGRFEFRVMDYARESLPGEPGGFDLIVSALSVHHLAHGDRRETVRKIHVSLRSGGWFVNADQISGETPEAGQDYHEEHMKAEPHGMTAVEHATLHAQMTWLEEAGFEKVECCYEKNRFVVYGGRKS